MLIYRDDHRRVRTADALARVADRRGAADPEAALSFFIDVAELEAAVVDALSPERDALDPIARAMRDATRAAAGEVRLPDGRLIGDDDADTRQGSDARTAVRQAIDFISREPLPDTLPMRVSEGYAYYALFPETYAFSADRFWTAVRPARMAVIGIRSIGTGLSAIVAERLRAKGCETWSCTVRPRGHPFDRRLALRHDVEDAWRLEADRGSVFAVVDEGPGLSGSSFAAVVEAIERFGVAGDRIVLFPSWDPDPARLKSERARTVWEHHVRWCTDARETGLTPSQLCEMRDDWIDFAAGAWRATICGDERNWPAAHPQHERWKIAAPRERRIVRFAGLGRYGTAARDRAAALCDLGVGAPPGPLRHGFLELPFVPGTPLAACGSVSDAVAVGTYLGTVARAFPRQERADAAALAQVIETNLRELVGDDAVRRVDLLVNEAPRDLPSAYIDGRMLAHEWIRADASDRRHTSDARRPGGANGLVKVDALDHARDHFYPGPQSPAWDLAAASLELGMDGAEELAMLDAFERVSRDRRARDALAFYKIAYAAFRGGYASMAADSLAGGSEGQRFARVRDGWRRYLESALARRLTPSAP